MAKKLPFEIREAVVQVCGKAFAPAHGTVVTAIGYTATFAHQ
jgi:hypothetical protein